MGMSSSKKNSRIVMSEINVTPFVDVMLVLLIIFMVTAPMMQQGLQVDLPETANSGVSTTEDPLTLVIKRDQKVYVSDVTLKVSQLRKWLKATLSTRKNKQVYIQADKRVNYGIVAETMAEVKAAGVLSIGFITVPKQTP